MIHFIEQKLEKCLSLYIRENILQADNALIDVFGNENVSKSFHFFVRHRLPQVFFCSLSVIDPLREFAYETKQFFFQNKYTGATIT